MSAWFKRRYLDILASIYIYNEHRGYTAIDTVLAAVRQRWPEDVALIAMIERHRKDERSHYLMFRRWFERQGVMPIAVGRTYGHIDRFVEIMFGTRIARLDSKAIVASDRLFERMCRVISLTEKRGYRQVELLLQNGIVRSDPVMTRIFEIIRKDEPSHWAPYDRWLQAHGKRDPRWWERAVDSLVHAELLFLKLPVLFLTPGLRRRADWPEASDPAA